MRLLAIETSCDETAIAVLECTGDVNGATFTVLGDALFSQAHLHAEYGGVFPTLAKREHIKNLPILLGEALVSAAEKVLGSPVPSSTVRPDFSHADTKALAAELKIELIAVTQGPGLEPALWTGIEFAKKLGEEWGVPVAGTDHMEGHIFSGLVESAESSLQNADGSKVAAFRLLPTAFPVLALLISGGHTELVLMREWFTYELLGRTKDDAVGEAFDKVARLLDLPYPGGPKVSEHATLSRTRGATHDIVFPRPLSHDNTCDFSFSGLKTAVLYKTRDMGTLSQEDKEHVAHAFEDAARDVIVLKTRRALEATLASTVAVGGGVSANTAIRKGLEELATEFPGTTLAMPHKALTGDNAIMIGMAAYLRHMAGAPTNPLEASGAQRLAMLPSQNGSQVP